MPPICSSNKLEDLAKPTLPHFEYHAGAKVFTFKQPCFTHPFRFYALNKMRNGNYGEICCLLLTNRLHVLASLAMPARRRKIVGNGA